MGVCTPWCTGDDIANAEPKLTAANPNTDFDQYALAASDLLWRAAGRRFPGLCSKTVRPCTGSSCFGFQTIQGSGHIISFDRFRGWRNEVGGTYCGCGIVPAIELSGTVVSIDQVKLDGAVLDESTYRVESGRYLIRQDGGGWPHCQNLSVPDTDPGAFAVSYTWGANPPAIGRLAAIELGVQLALQGTGQASRLTTFGITQLQRQGVTISRQNMESIQKSGLPTVTVFLSSVNPKGRIRRAAVWSPDTVPAARRF